MTVDRVLASPTLEVSQPSGAEEPRGEGPEGSPGRWLRRLGFGCLTVLGLVVVGVLFVLSQFSMIDCGLNERSATSRDTAITLDDAHPTAVQRVVLRITAEGLPADLDEGSITLDVQRRVELVPYVRPADVEVVFAEEGGVVDRRVSNVRAPDARGFVDREATSVNCAVGQPCERTYRVTYSLTDVRPGASVSFASTVRGRVRYARLYGECGPPRDALVTIEASPATLLDKEQLARSSTPRREEKGTILARHFVVDTAAAPDPAASITYARLRIKANGQMARWLRIFSDDGGPAMVDQLLATPQSGPAEIEGAIDIPILADCEPTVPCSRGYWMVLQSFPPQPSRVDGGWESVEALRATVRWNVETRAIALVGQPPVSPASVKITDVRADLGQSPVVQTETIEMPIGVATPPQAIDLQVTIPTRPAPADGLDPLTASLIVVHLQANDSEVHGDLEGAGAADLPFYWDLGMNLVAHPFDTCPPVGSCQAHLQLVGSFIDDPHSRGGGPSGITWRVSALGVPVGTVLSVGPVVDRPPPPDPGIPALMALGLAVAVVVVIVEWRRRRRATHGRVASGPRTKGSG